MNLRARQDIIKRLILDIERTYDVTLEQAIRQLRREVKEVSN